MATTLQKRLVGYIRYGGEDRLSTLQLWTPQEWVVLIGDTPNEALSSASDTLYRSTYRGRLGHPSEGRLGYLILQEIAQELEGELIYVLPETPERPGKVY
jgi:hypothetical protein